MCWAVASSYCRFYIRKYCLLFPTSNFSLKCCFRDPARDLFLMSLFMFYCRIKGEPLNFYFYDGIHNMIFPLRAWKALITSTQVCVQWRTISGIFQAFTQKMPLNVCFSLPKQKEKEKIFKYLKATMWLGLSSSLEAYMSCMVPGAWSQGEPSHCERKSTPAHAGSLDVKSNYIFHIKKPTKSMEKKVSHKQTMYF